jgi:paraquat-inducible protein A
MPTPSLCPRCRTPLSLRKPASLIWTSVLLIAAYALYVPANMLPILVTERLLDTQTDTILTGTVYLWFSGAWPLAVIVFLASIVLPLAKLLVLTFLVLSVDLRLRISPLRRVQSYRLLHAIGRWSMLDIFVAAMLAGAVQFQTLASIRPGSGAIAFAGVVILTMLAANTFDPRLIWDTAGESHE